MEETAGKAQVSVVIPVYNEEMAISEVIRSIKKVLEPTPYSFEILVVDDGSEDNTVEAAEDQKVKIIHHGENRGSGASRKTGILASQGEWIVMIDGDGTYATETVPEIIGHLDSFSQVIGARIEEKGTHKIFRISAKESIRRLASFLVGKRIPDLNSGLRGFRKADMLEFLYMMPDGFSFVSSMTLAFLVNNLPVKFVPTRYFERIGHSKFHPIRDTYNYLLTVVRIMAYFAPLNVFMPLCFLFLALGVVKGLFDLLWTGSLQESDIIIVLTGIIIGALGILADLIVTQGRKHHGQNR